MSNSNPFDAMRHGWIFILAWIMIAGIGLIAVTPVQGQPVQSTTPSQNAIDAATTVIPEVTFDSNVGQPDIQVYGSRNGRYSPENISYNGATVSFDPVCPFLPGETVTITVSGGNLAEPFVWQFTVRSEEGTGEFDPEEPIELSDAQQAGGAAKVGSVVIPSAPYSGDFDKDGFGDLAIVNQEQGEVVVLTRIAANSPTRITLPVPDATTLTAGDVTGNGYPDLVTVNSYDNTLTVIRNQNGSFPSSQQTTLSTGPRPIDAAVADLDGDGAQDLAVSAFGTDQVAIHFNDGNGNFAAPEFVNVSAAPSSIAARDMDNDGDLDLLVASAGENQIDWLANDGSGQFNPSGSLALPFTPGTLITNDILGSGGPDGWVDLIVSAQNDGRIVAYQADTDPSTFDFSSASAPGAPDPALGGVLADIDADVNLDLASTYAALGELRIALNNDNTGFQLPSNVTGIYPSGPEPVGVAALDFDANSSQDLAVFNQRGTTLRLFRNTGGDVPLRLSFDPDQLDFPDVCEGASETLSLNITSNENESIDVSYPTSLVGGVFTVSGGGAFTLPAGGGRSLSVTFTPADTTTYEQNLPFTSSLSSSSSGACPRGTSDILQVVPLTGTGTAPVLSAAPDTVDFGEISPNPSPPPSQSVNLDNVGNGPVDDIRVEIQGDSDAFSVGDIGLPLPRSVEIEFDPAAPNAEFSADVLFIANAGNTSCASDTVAVHVTGKTGPAMPDLVAEQVNVVEGDPNGINVSQSLSVNCTFSNQGNEEITQSFSVVIARNGETIDTFLYSPFELPNLGESLTTDATEITFSSRGSASVTCTADADENITERSEDNNTATLDVSVQVADQLEVGPNPFTPNGDGFNDVARFRVSEFGLSQPVLEIYSFEGHPVRTVSEMQGGELRWGGRDDSNQAQPPGVYIYTVRENGQTVASGHITLAR